MSEPGPETAPPVGLLIVDQCRRWQQGERVAIECYLEQHPTLRADSEGLLDLIYNEVLLRQAKFARRGKLGNQHGIIHPW